MAISAVPSEMQAEKPFASTLKARGERGVHHEAKDLVVFSPRLYKPTWFP